MSTVGDVGYVDADGYLYLTDRATFMIISGGVNIYPQECENLLITHPKVADAAVFGVPNEDLGEEVKAVVQPMPGIDRAPDIAAELIAFCGQHLAPECRARSISRPSCRACRPASSTSACCATAIGAAQEPDRLRPATIVIEVSYLAWYGRRAPRDRPARREGPTQIGRRPGRFKMTLLKHGLAIAALALAAGIAAAASADEKPIRIGVLNDMSGPYSDYQGPGSVLAAQMAVEDFGGQVAGQSR